MKLKWYFLIIACLWGCEKESLAQTIIRGPYLQLGTTKSITIKWRTDTATDSKVWYGESSAKLKLEEHKKGNRTDHEVSIKGLKANTTYFYAIGNDHVQLAGADEKHFFTTAPTPTNASTTRVWVLGDCGTGNDKARAVRDGYYKFIGQKQTDLILLLGDNAYPDGTDDDYQKALFDQMYTDKITNTVMWPSTGNHDLRSSNSDAQSGPYYDIFSCPTRAEAGGVPSGTEAYYSFDYGDIHFISLDTDDLESTQDLPMLRWLRKDLASTKQQWKVVFFHHPPYSRGAYDSDAKKTLTRVRQNVVPLLEAEGVDLVLSGHNHSYARSYLINGHYGLSSSLTQCMVMNKGDGRIDGDGAYQKPLGAKGKNKGTVYVVAGSAGKLTPAEIDHPVMHQKAAELGSLYLEISGHQMDVKFIDVEGKAGDYFSIIKKEVVKPPSVRLTGPINGSYYQPGQKIKLTADAFDENGTINYVNFFVNCVSVGIDSKAPFECDWTIPSDGAFTIKATTEDNDLNHAASTQTQVRAGIIQACSRISKSSDDAEEEKSGKVDITSTDLELVKDGSDQIIGLRFSNLHIPPTALIHSAHIQFAVDETDNKNPCLFNIFGEATADPPPFKENTHNISRRVRTRKSITWQPGNWVTKGASGAAQRTADLSEVIQELINMKAYSSNDSIGIIIEGVGKRVAESFDGMALMAPELCVEYTVNTTSQDD